MLKIWFDMKWASQRSHDEALRDRQQRGDRTNVPSSLDLKVCEIGNYSTPSACYFLILDNP